MGPETSLQPPSVEESRQAGVWLLRRRLASNQAAIGGLERARAREKGSKCSIMRQRDHRSMKSLSYSKHVQPSLNRLHQERRRRWRGGVGWGTRRSPPPTLATQPFATSSAFSLSPLLSSEGWGRETHTHTHTPLGPQHSFWPPPPPHRLLPRPTQTRFCTFPLLPGTDGSGQRHPVG